MGFGAGTNGWTSPRRPPITRTPPESRRLSGEPMAKDHKRLGEMLIEAKLITPQQLDGAITEQRRTGRLLGATLIGMGLVSEDALLQVLKNQLGLQLVDLAHTAVDEQALSRIKEDLAK